MTFSMGTMASPPLGMGAPVMILIAVCKESVMLGLSPAYITSWVLTVFPASATLTTYPSIAELLNLGKLKVDI